MTIKLLPSVPRIVALMSASAILCAYLSGLPGPKKIKKAKFVHKQFQKWPNPQK